MYVFLSVTYMCVSILWSWFSRFLANTMSFYYLISLSIVIVRCWDMIGSRVVKSLWEQNGCAMCLFNRVASNGFIYWCGHCVTPRWSHGCLIFLCCEIEEGCGPMLIFMGLSVSPSSGMMMYIYLLCGGPKSMGECVFIIGIGWRRRLKPKCAKLQLDATLNFSKYLSSYAGIRKKEQWYLTYKTFPS